MAWRYQLCTLTGTAIADLSAIADDPKGVFRLNRPAQLTFRVPSDHREVSTLHSDSYPMLEAKRRVVKAFRKEGSTWAIRFTGHVWSLEDIGDANTAWTHVTCFDPMQMLARRLCRASDGTNVDLVPFTATDGIQIVKTLIDRSQNNAIVGSGGDKLGIDTTSGSFPTGTSRTVTYSRKDIFSVVVELMEADTGFDLSFLPLNLTTGKLVQLNAYQPKRGTAKDGARLEWGMGRNNIREVKRLRDGGELVNILGVGATGGANSNFTYISDSASAGAYGNHEDVSTYDVSTTAHATALGNEELNYRENPRNVVEIVPVAGRAPSPWTDFDLGDTVPVNLGARLRGGASGYQRIYGFDVDMGDVEVVSRLLTSPEGV